MWLQRGKQVSDGRGWGGKQDLHHLTSKACVRSLDIRGELLHILNGSVAEFIHYLISRPVNITCHMVCKCLVSE